MPDQTLADVTRPFLPTQPTFDLAREAWLDVCAPDGSRPERVGLEHLLGRAHELVLDDAARGPLWKHAIQRLLIALTYLIRARTPEHGWDEVAAGTAALPADGIRLVLDRFADHLWLHHPDTPFLQDLTVLGAMTAPARSTRDDDVAWLVKGTDPFWTLLPDVPSKSNTAWFGRDDERPRQTQADAAAGLLVRHYVAMPGNEGRNRLAGGGRSEGGATGLTHNGRSFATVAGPTLAAMLARNLLGEWVRITTPDTPTYLDDRDVASALADPHPLWAYTASCAATVLVPVADEPHGYRVVRTPVPVGKALAKRLAAVSSAGDPHGLRVDAKTKGQPYSHVSLSAEGSDLDLVRKVYGDLVRSPLHAPSVLGERSLAHLRTARRDVDVLVIDGAGGATGPRIGGTASFAPPTGTFDADPDRMGWFLDLANQLLGGKDAAATQVGTAVLRVLAPEGNAPKGKRTAVYATARHDLSVAVEPVLRDLLKTAIGGGDLPDRFPPVHVATVVDSALAVFGQLVAPHQQRPAAVPLIVQQEHRLRANLRRTLEPV